MDQPQPDGTAIIKSEYLVTRGKSELVTEFLSDAVKRELQTTKDSTNSSATHTKKAKLTGRNKRRPQRNALRIVNKSYQLCFQELQGGCKYGDTCKYLHDVKEFLSSKPEDIGPKCVLFDLYGNCKSGVTCRFGSGHINVEGENVISAESEGDGRDNVCNVLSVDLRYILWKKKYDFKRADSVLARMESKKQKVDEDIDLEEGDAISGDFSENVDELKRKTVVTTGLEGDVTETESVVTETESVVTESESVVKESENIENDGTVSEITGVNVLKEKSDCLVQSVEAVDTNRSGPISLPKCDAHDTLIDIPQGKSEDRIVAQDASNANSDMKIDECGTDVEQGDMNIENCDATVEERDIKTGESNINGSSSFQPMGCLADEVDLKRQPKKTIDFRDKLYLAPLTTVGNLPFRRICKDFGADITCGEMAVSSSLLGGLVSEWALVKRHSSEDIFGVQLCGGNAEMMSRCAELLNDTCSMDFVDINCGCPIDFIYQRGQGAALMGRANRLESIVSSMSSILDVPLTVKMRTGVYSNKHVAHKLVERLGKAGASLITIHGRSREQRYTRTADWAYIDECCKKDMTLPIFGNGDVLSYRDYKQHREETNVAGAMIARGALIKPWIFREIKDQTDWDISATERLDILQKYVNYGLEHWGSDDKGVETTRYFLLEWLSFTYRYIPVGILEHPPQRINEKPPHYRGRDDLETLLSSSHCGDWIKITEMFLGPVPKDFHFLPKHKANAYK